jgi:hypothetical protein
MDVTGYPQTRVSLVNFLLALILFAAMVHPAKAGWIQYAPDATIELVSATYTAPEQGEAGNPGNIKLTVRRTIHSSYLGGSTGFYSHVRWETFNTGSGSGYAIANTDYTQVYDDTIDGEDGSTGPVNRLIWFDSEPWVSTKDILIPITDDASPRETKPSRSPHHRPKLSIRDIAPMPKREFARLQPVASLTRWCHARLHLPGNRHDHRQ